ncbi:MAG TPA: THUMP domain-containing protein [archaeon]|nr:THUMP domain-containing protein [archaeon]
MECLLLRVGEITLRSDWVYRSALDTLRGNLERALQGEKCRIVPEEKRIFVYSENAQKAMPILKRIFGITSISPALACDSEMGAIKNTALKVSKRILNSRRSFAVRAERKGGPIGSRELNNEVGSAVAVKTGAKVNLSNPDVEIFIECRREKALVYSEKIRGAGGLPLGSSGRAFALLRSRRDLEAAVLMMKRGLELEFIASDRKLLNAIEKWNLGRKLRAQKAKNSAEISKFLKASKCRFLVAGSGLNLKGSDMLVLNPLEGVNSSKILFTNR